MSHATISEIKAEPNLVPLLDLVFQLIMFFIISVNFVGNQADKKIKLPDAQSARPMDKKEADVLILNLRDNGKVKVLGEQELLSTPGEIKYFLRRQYENAKARREQSGDKSNEVQTAIVIRADQNANYGQIFQLLSFCKEIGYHKLQLRARHKKAGG
jgi:biopolymer transport protein ExbD